MEQTTDDLNEEYSLNTSTLSQDSSSVFDEPESSSNATSKSRKAVESSVVPWRFCLSQLQKCKDLKNRTKFKELITKYSQSHFQQRKKDALAKGKLIWTDFDSRYGIDAGDNWLNVEADLIAREDPYYSFVNILVKADPSSGVPCRAIKRVNGECRGHPEHTIKTVKDPRTRLKKAPRTVPLLVPKYPLDDYIDFAPPRREIAFIELNDNCKREKRTSLPPNLYTSQQKEPFGNGSGRIQNYRTSNGLL
ncbi:hypothetical protein M3Y97_00809900 [Aphelenchoides bicaudatus]|nr:hypothetical protein M3Y97_00809900 [Aphelenchoides bicaudatus]